MDHNRKSINDDTEDSHNCGATLVGLRADPGTSPEDWESDFDFDSSTSILPPPAATRSLMDASSPAGSSPRAAITVSERRDLEELLKTLPTYPRCSENILLQNLPVISKLGIKDLLREMQSTSLVPSDPLSDLQSSTKDNTDSPKAGCVESHEWNLNLARGKKNLQVCNILLPTMEFKNNFILEG